MGHGSDVGVYAVLIAVGTDPVNAKTGASGKTNPCG
jgi:hypothetical protein